LPDVGGGRKLVQMERSYSGFLGIFYNQTLYNSEVDFPTLLEKFPSTSTLGTRWTKLLQQYTRAPSTVLQRGWMKEKITVFSSSM
jgi:hypothetical protein